MKRIGRVQVFILFSVLYNAKASDKLYTTKSGLLCMKCFPGFHLVADCHINMTTSACRPCKPGYVAEGHNIDMNCSLCSQSCPDDMERVSNCSSTRDINCTCKSGYHRDEDHNQCRKNKNDVPGLQSNDETAMKKANDSRTPYKGSEVHSSNTTMNYITLGLQILIVLIQMRQLQLLNNFFKCRSCGDAKNKLCDNTRQKGDAQREPLLGDITPQVINLMKGVLSESGINKKLDYICESLQYLMNEDKHQETNISHSWQGLGLPMTGIHDKVNNDTTRVGNDRETMVHENVASEGNKIPICDDNLVMYQGPEFVDSFVNLALNKGKN